MGSFVEASINYGDASGAGDVLHDQAPEFSTLKHDRRTVRVHDARAAGPFSLRHNGFQLVRSPNDVDLRDQAQVAARYRPRMRSMLRALTGASKVLEFDQKIRAENEPDHSGPEYAAHVDHDEETVRGIVRMISPEPERLLAKRFAMFNLWRPITSVERTPLALCDASTIEAGDLRLGKPRFAAAGSAPALPVAGYSVTFNAAHRWWYFPHMRPDEVLVFKQVDSEPAAVRCTAHCAFDDPTSPADSAPRASLELRMIAFFD